MTETLQEASERYQKAAHAMQTGVAMMMNYDDSHTPKHLRTGINSALVTSQATARLMIEKGIITELEYYIAMADAMEEEVAHYVQEIESHVGAEVKLV